MSVPLSVCPLDCPMPEPKSRTEERSKPKIDGKEDRVTGDPI